ncbi:MAG: hypothetical protein OEY52_03030 [Gammaproteobacteria bacterium]|nr:hypothetical protein [Gammaproteobacteria bacterium]
MPQLVIAGFQGSVQTTTTHHENFNMAKDETQAEEETVQTVQASLSYYKASSKEFVWVANAYYSYSEYDKYHHLSGSSVTLLGGIFYRFDESNSMTIKLGKRERNYDDEDLSLYQDDAHFMTLQLSQRLSSTTLLNEKVKYEENVPKIDSNKYTSTQAQIWFVWNLARSSRLTMGYTQTRRSYDNRNEEYTFDEPYMNISYNLTRNIFTRIGYSKLKLTDQTGGRAYNKTAYISLGMGF